MFEVPTQPSSIVLEIANVRGKILMKYNDDDTDQEISNDESEDPGECTLSSNIDEDHLDHQQVVLYLVQARRDKTIWTTRVPLPKKQSRADTVIACTSLQNLRQPARATALPLLQHHKSTINISCESDIVKTLALPKAYGDQNVPQPKPEGGDNNIPQHEKATFEVAKCVMEAIIFTRTPWPIMFDEKYSMVD